jgi:hypothetical protein
MMILFFFAVLCKDFIPLPLRVGRSAPVKEAPWCDAWLPAKALLAFSFDFAEVTLLSQFSTSAPPTIEPAILCLLGVGKPRSL